MTTLNSWLIPSAILLAICGLFRWSQRELPLETRLLEAASLPLEFQPGYDDPRMVTDDQLSEVLARMAPRRDTANSNYYLHALRLWGPNAVFEDPAAISGAEMLAYFLDDAKFQEIQGENTPSLFSLQGETLIARPWKSWEPHAASSSAHTDDIMATFAEVALPLNAPLHTREGIFEVGDLFRGAMRRFHLQRDEYEWFAIAYARYGLPLESWTNQFGERISVADVAHDLIEQPPRHGVCGGTHRLEALVLLLEAGRAQPMLPARVQRQSHGHLHNMSQRLVQSQHPEGWWSKDWADLHDHPTSHTDRESPSLSERILATGHHLEWLALAPEEILPPREVLVRAAQWLTRAMLEVDEATLQRDYGPFSHAARALCLWRGQEAGTWASRSRSDLAANVTPH